MIHSYELLSSPIHRDRELNGGWLRAGVREGKIGSYCLKAIEFHT
jgi:hypothetical protein